MDVNNLDLMKAHQTTQFLASLGSHICDVRRSKNLTQSQLAELVSVEPETISRLERGVAAPSIQRLLILAHALDVSVDELLTGASPLFSDKVRLLDQELKLINKLDQDLVLDMAIQLAARLSKGPSCQK